MDAGEPVVDGQVGIGLAAPWPFLLRAEHRLAREGRGRLGLPGLRHHLLPGEAEPFLACAVEDAHRRDERYAVDGKAEDAGVLV